MVAGRFSEWPEYRAVEARHHDRYAKRSGLPYMNHVDEGIAVLRDLGASERAQRAFCLHPLLQADDALAGQAYPDVAALTADPRVLCLALEYRNVANAYLSRREVSSDDAVALSPLAEVNDMLRADKVQNAKDFLLHHRATHPRARGARPVLPHLAPAPRGERRGLRPVVRAAPVPSDDRAHAGVVSRGRP